MNTSNSQLKPVKVGKRIAYLDVLRGIAILFIFCANIVYFSGYYDYPSENRLPSAVFRMDSYFELIMFTLVDGKFYSIFSLLFGIGFAIQYNNLSKYSISYVSFFRRRMLSLLVIGLIHLLFLWMGDILTLYALLGLILIWFLQTNNKSLLKWAGVLILLPILNWIIINTLGWNYPAYFYSLNIKYNQSIGNAINRFADILKEGRALKVLGIFLIGLWVGRKILNENLLNHAPFIKKVAIWGIGIGLPISVIRTYITFFFVQDQFWSFIKTISYTFGTVPLSIGYAALIALLYQNKTVLLNRFAPVGKMALTNYLLQTILAKGIFFVLSYVVGGRGKFGFTVVVSIALIVFSLQVVFSKRWLRHYKFGPMEFIWRQLTYGKRIKNRIYMSVFF